VRKESRAWEGMTGIEGTLLLVSCMHSQHSCTRCIHRKTAFSHGDVFAKNPHFLLEGGGGIIILHQIAQPLRAICNYSGCNVHFGFPSNSSWKSGGSLRGPEGEGQLVVLLLATGTRLACLCLLVLLAICLLAGFCPALA
jgi:hypothetical protein